MAHPGGEVIRLGGDEFLLCLLAPTTIQDPLQMPRRVMSAVAEPVPAAGRAIVGCSIGLATWTAGMSVETLLNRADQAMYAAKSNGRGTWFQYDDALGARMRDEAALESDLRDAVRDGVIEPWFQPIFDIANGRILAVESLARWNHPTRGQIPPDRFIAMADDLGLLPTLSRHLLIRSAHMLADIHPTLELAFNLSPSQLVSHDLLDMIRDVLAQTGLSPARLEIEVTEQAVIRNFDQALQTITGLQALGVRVALDDFGTGMSSLSVLSRLPLNAIKIDRSFVTSIGDNPQNRKIVQALLVMAQSMHIDVTAEGIETKTELSVLRDLKCRRGQGYLVSRPVPGPTLSRLLRDGADGASDAA
jgi:predicted signal transduction protein with EAL and GGDEF domain